MALLARKAYRGSFAAFTRRFIVVTVFLLTLNCLLGEQNHSENKIRTFRSACEIEYPPFSMITSDGRAAGFSVELLKEVLGVMNSRATFTTGTWTEIKQLLENGEVDILPLVGRTPEREAAFDFSVPYLTMHGTIVTKADSDNPQTLKDIKNKRIAVMQSDNAEEFLRRSLPDINPITTPTFHDAFLLLTRGECDAVVIQRLVALMLIKEHGFHNLQLSRLPLTEFRQDFCFAVKSGDKETLSLLNEGLAIAVADGTFRRLHAKWFANLELPENRTIIVGGSHDYPPYEFIDGDGKPSGYNVDLTRAVFRSVGMECEIQLGPWKKMIKKLKSGEIDLIQGMLFSELRSETFDFSPPHSFNSGVVVSRKDSFFEFTDIDSLKGRSIAVQNGDIMHEFAVLNGLTSYTITFSSQEEALRSVVDGHSDLALAARLTALYSKSNNNWQNLKIWENELTTHDYCFVANKGQKALMAKISEGLQILEDSGEFRKIQRKWFGLQSENLIDWRTIAKYAALVIVPLIITGLFFVFWSWTLRREVRLRTEELRASESKFRNLIEAAPDAVFVQTEGKFSYINKAGLSLFGVKSASELLNQDILSSFDSSFRDLIQHRIGLLNTHRQQVPPLETIVIKADKSTSVVETSATPVNYEGKDGAIVFIRDLSERRKLENQLRQAQKLESMGMLAGGVAHDYNNMLSVILGYAELASSRVTGDKKTSGYIHEIIKAARKSGEITAQLLTFARQQSISPKVINLQKTIDDTIKMLRRLIGENIRLIWQTSSTDEDCLALIDPVQFDQILANLVINARDAAGDTGTVKIELYQKKVIESANSCPPGNYSVLQVSDDGCGMTQHVISRIFDPFYTTKELGKGTGLGLATVYGIVKQNDGFIDVISEPGQGSTFRVFFKLIDQESAVALSEKSEMVAQGSGELILVVEDDLSILSLTRQILEGMGYRVITASSPYKALEIVENTNENISLVLSDVVMPDMNGKDLIIKLRQMIPGIKCLLMTGYSADAFSGDFFEKDGPGIIAKPFSIATLSQKVKEIMALR